MSRWVNHITQYDLFEFRKREFEGRFGRPSRDVINACRTWITVPFHLKTDGYFTKEYISSMYHDEGYEIIRSFATDVYNKLKNTHPDILRINYKIDNVSPELPMRIVEEIITNNFQMTVKLKYVCSITHCINDFYEAHHAYMRAHNKKFKYIEYVYSGYSAFCDEYTKDVGVSKYATRELYKPKTNYYTYKELERDMGWRVST